MEQIEVNTIINASLERVWECWTSPKHIVKWNFASSDWYCPKVENNLIVGGEFHYIMAAKDESFRFDFWGTYVTIVVGKRIEILIGDGRKMSVCFEFLNNQTKITEKFEPETENSKELQKEGWQSIVDNFKLYVENSLST